MNANDLLAALPAAALSETCLRRLDQLTITLIEQAARHTPPAFSQRLQEEWLADLAARAGRLSRLRLAAGCWWAASVITREYGVTGLAAAGPNKAVAYAPLQARGFLSPRTVALVLIACLHLALIYFLAVGMANRTAQAPPPPIVVIRAQNPNPTLPPPPPLPPKFAHPKIDTIEPDIPIEVPAETQGLQTVPVDRSQQSNTSPTPPKVDRVPGGPGKGFPNTADYYPDASRRLGEKGVASVQVCVDASGRLTSDPAITHSSGIARLDAGALTLAKAGSGHYRPTIEDGRAVGSCFPFRIRFEFRE
ncbi:MAG: energy transducer TonB [Steroidobacteraceae bacterium]